MLPYFVLALSDMFQFKAPYVLSIFGPFFLIVAVILLLKYIKKEFSLLFLIWRLALLFVAYVYTMGVLLITRVAAIPLSVYQNLLEGRALFYFSAPQLIPFSSITIGTDMFGNLLLLLPLGFLLPLWFRNLKNFHSVSLIVMSTSILIELLQFIFGVGVPSIDDVLLNTIGGIIGLSLYKLVKILVRKSKFTRRS